MIKSKHKIIKATLQVHARVGATDYKIESKVIQNKEYWVVPVVMMVEGVHHGSKGPLLYSEEELADSASDWSGMPVVIGHPKDSKGKYISANSPEAFAGIV